MWLQYLAIASPFIATMLLGLYFKITLPRLVQNVLDDVGAQLEEIFKNPTISKAYGILAKHSGEVRADNALRTRFANKVVEQIPSIAGVLDWLEMEPLDAIRLWQDPLVGPIIQQFVGGAMHKIGKGLNMPTGNPSNGTSQGRQMT